MINKNDLTQCSGCRKFELEDGTYGMYYPRFPMIGKDRRYAISSGQCPSCSKKAMEEIENLEVA